MAVLHEGKIMIELAQRTLWLIVGLLVALNVLLFTLNETAAVVQGVQSVARAAVEFPTHPMQRSVP